MNQARPEGATLSALELCSRDTGPSGRAVNPAGLCGAIPTSATPVNDAGMPDRAVEPDFWLVFLCTWTLGKVFKAVQVLVTVQESYGFRDNGLVRFAVY